MTFYMSDMSHHHHFTVKINSSLQLDLLKKSRSKHHGLLGKAFFRKAKDAKTK